MKDKIIQITVDNQGHVIGLSEAGTLYQLNDKNIDNPLWEHVIDAPMEKDQSQEIHIAGVDETKKKLEEIKEQGKPLE